MSWHKKILGVVLSGNFPYKSHLYEMLDIHENSIDLALADLTSIFLRDKDRINFRHTLLPTSF